MNFLKKSFRKLLITESATNTAVGFISILGGVGVAVTCVASTDQVQKIHIKHKLLSVKLTQPSHMTKVLHCVSNSISGCMSIL